MTSTCTVPGCRTVAVHQLVLPLCAEHRDRLVVALLPEYAARYREPHTWVRALQKHPDLLEPADIPEPARQRRRAAADRQRAARQNPRQPEPVVYFIRVGDRVKIGWSTDYRSRFRQLTLPGDAQVVRTEPGGPSEEAALHARFAPHRIGNTEWFYVRDDLADLLEAQP